MNLLPQEIEVWYVLPALRKEIARVLIEKGLKQKDVAKTMGITEASVSQYVKGKRGAELKFNKESRKTIEKKISRITKSPENFSKELSNLSKHIMNKGVVCNFHKKRDRKVPVKCSICSVRSD